MTSKNARPEEVDLMMSQPRPQHNFFRVQRASGTEMKIPRANSFWYCAIALHIAYCIAITRVHTSSWVETRQSRKIRSRDNTNKQSPFLTDGPGDNARTPDPEEVETFRSMLSVPQPRTAAQLFVLTFSGASGTEMKSPSANSFWHCIALHCTAMTRDTSS